MMKTVRGRVARLLIVVTVALSLVSADSAAGQSGTTPPPAAEVNVNCYLLPPGTPCFISDVMGRRAGSSTWITAPTSPVKARVRRAGSVSFDVRFLNDGNTTGDFFISWAQGNRNFVVKVFRPDIDPSTPVAGAFVRTLDPGETYDIRVEVRVRRTARPGTSFSFHVGMSLTPSHPAWGYVSHPFRVTSLCNPDFDNAACRPRR